MTLDEAIEHCKEVAKNKIECEDCNNEHVQLAEWLEEFKRHKEEKEVVVETIFNINRYEYDEYMMCPSCESKRDVGNFYNSELYFKFCPDCGQRLKFTESVYE